MVFVPYEQFLFVQTKQVARERDTNRPRACIQTLFDVGKG
jgi:hypothetical protein